MDMGGPVDPAGAANRIRVTVNTAFASRSSLQVNLVEDTQPSLATATVLLSGPTLAGASLIPGAVLFDSSFPKTAKR